ncbi:putative multi-domain containing protein [Aduncisulcus paluster]|uniref:Multi-domain containing protein n=1 Tax=Aduncisulcus paluster TaxID=2918883 RepID=A0ABQ5JVY1_9EUKA|nr:putative multi-domain containing protein [Aduncisulcus paluster]
MVFWDFVKSLFSRRKREVKILFLGLDGAGKTTIVTKLCGRDVSLVQPTEGFNAKTISMSGISMNIWDIGGQAKIRPYWRHYFEGCEGLVFVVDSSDRERMEETGDELNSLLETAELSGVPLLVFANKQDLVTAYEAAEICKLLELEEIESSRPWRIQDSSAKRGTGLEEVYEYMRKITKSRLPYSIMDITVYGITGTKGRIVTTSEKKGSKKDHKSALLAQVQSFNSLPIPILPFKWLELLSEFIRAALEPYLDRLPQKILPLSPSAEEMVLGQFSYIKAFQEEAFHTSMEKVSSIPKIRSIPENNPINLLQRLMAATTDGLRINTLWDCLVMIMIFQQLPLSDSLMALLNTFVKKNHLLQRSLFFVFTAHSLGQEAILHEAQFDGLIDRERKRLEEEKNPDIASNSLMALLNTFVKKNHLLQRSLFFVFTAHSLGQEAILHEAQFDGLIDRERKRLEEEKNPDIASSIDSRIPIHASPDKRRHILKEEKDDISEIEVETEKDEEEDDIPITTIVTDPMSSPDYITEHVLPYLILPASILLSESTFMALRIALLIKWDAGASRGIHEVREQTVSAAVRFLDGLLCLYTHTDPIGGGCDGMEINEAIRRSKSGIRRRQIKLRDQSGNDIDPYTWLYSVDSVRDDVGMFTSKWTFGGESRWANIVNQWTAIETEDVDIEDSASEGDDIGPKEEDNVEEEEEEGEGNDDSAQMYKSDVGETPWYVYSIAKHKKDRYLKHGMQVTSSSIPPSPDASFSVMNFLSSSSPLVPNAASFCDCVSLLFGKLPSGGRKAVKTRAGLVMKSLHLTNEYSECVKDSQLEGSSGFRKNKKKLSHLYNTLCGIDSNLTSLCVSVPSFESLWAPLQLLSKICWEDSCINGLKIEKMVVRKPSWKGKRSKKRVPLYYIWDRCSHELPSSDSASTPSSMLHVCGTLSKLVIILRVLVLCGEEMLMRCIHTFCSSKLSKVRKEKGMEAKSYELDDEHSENDITLLCEILGVSNLRESPFSAILGSIIAARKKDVGHTLTNADIPSGGPSGGSARDVTDANMISALNGALLPCEVHSFVVPSLEEVIQKNKEEEADEKRRREYAERSAGKEEEEMVEDPRDVKRRKDKEQLNKALDAESSQITPSAILGLFCPSVSSFHTIGAISLSPISFLSIGIWLLRAFSLLQASHHAQNHGIVPEVKRITLNMLKRFLVIVDGCIIIHGERIRAREKEREEREKEKEHRSKREKGKGLRKIITDDDDDDEEESPKPTTSLKSIVLTRGNSEEELLDILKMNHENAFCSIIEVRSLCKVLKTVINDTKTPDTRDRR